MVNWTMLPNMSRIWAKLLDEIIPNSERHQRKLFIDLADPEKRTHGDILDALKLLTRFQDQVDVILGLNLKESLEVAEWMTEVTAMKILVVYESQFGNTRHVAELVARGLEACGEVRLASFTAYEPALLQGVAPYDDFTNTLRVGDRAERVRIAVSTAALFPTLGASPMLGRVPFATIRSAYSASKHALNSLSANLRMELAASHPDIHVSVVLPGVVATDFGKSALHGGPDSRALQNAQPVEEVAEVIAGVIEKPRADVYTRPGAQQMVAAYYGAADLGEAERKPPFVMPAPQR